MPILREFYLSSLEPLAVKREEILRTIEDVRRSCGKVKPQFKDFPPVDENGFVPPSYLDKIIEMGRAPFRKLDEENPQQTQVNWMQNPTYKNVRFLMALADELRAGKFKTEEEMTEFIKEKSSKDESNYFALLERMGLKAPLLEMLFWENKDSKKTSEILVQYFRTVLRVCAEMMTGSSY
jgi:hypothetical protein